MPCLVQRVELGLHGRRDTDEVIDLCRIVAVIAFAPKFENCVFSTVLSRAQMVVAFALGVACSGYVGSSWLMWLAVSTVISALPECAAQSR